MFLKIKWKGVRYCNVKERLENREKDNLKITELDQNIMW